jgi:hypothetical protein
MYHRRTAAATLLALVLAHASPASALDLRKKYEEELIRWALGQAHLEADPDPRGKIIERIEIVRENIIAKSDPWPNFINWFHMKTRDFVVRQELLVKPGEVWNEALVEESARNLRALPILAVVRTVPCRSRLPNHVILLVVTKDLWSIRLNTILSGVGSIVSIDFNPSEMNFLGRNKRLAVHIGLSQLDFGPFKVRDNIILGERYFDNRILGTRLALYQYFDAIIAGDIPAGGKSASGLQWAPSTNSGHLEGAYAALELTRPLYSLATEWSFDLQAIADVRQIRYYRTAGGVFGLDTATRGSEALPQVYDRRRFSGAASLTRSYGRAYKHDITTSIGAYRRRYTVPDGFDTVFSEAAVQAYQRAYLPRSEDAAFVEVNYHTWQPRYLKLRDIRSFALTEDFVLGHDVSFTALGAANLPDTDIAAGFLSLSVAAGYTWYVRDDLLSVAFSAGTRYQPRLHLTGFDGPWFNSSVSGSVYNISPRLWIGRLHARVQTLVRSHNIDNAFTAILGGDTGLRGYPGNQFRSENLFQVNVEYRTLPINFFTLHLGLAIFYDGGGVWGRDPRGLLQDLPFSYYQSVGIGGRGHFPQFDKSSLRVDLGFPLSGSAGSVGTWFSFGFGQAF